MSRKHKLERRVRREVEFQTRRQMAKLRREMVHQVRHEVRVHDLEREVPLDDLPADEISRRIGR